MSVFVCVFHCMHSPVCVCVPHPGTSPGVAFQSTMTVEDCYELGKIAYSDADYYHTELWMAQALSQLDQGEGSLIDAVTILDYLSYSIYQQGELERALEYTKRLLALGKCSGGSGSNTICKCSQAYWVGFIQHVMMQLDTG